MAAPQKPKKPAKSTPSPRQRQPLFHESLPVGSPERSRLKADLLPRITHGGSATRGKRKTIRPFTPNVPLHLVMKSSRAKGPWSMLHRRHRTKILSMIYVYGARFKVHVYRASNVGNHLHLLVKAREKKQLQDFLRVLAGRVAITVTGARRGIKRLSPHPLLARNPAGPQFRRKFWDYLFWSRMVNWGKDFYNVSRYVLANELEAFSKEHREWLLNSWEITGAPIPGRGG